MGPRMTNENWGFETRQIHAGQEPDPATGARAVPIYQTTSYQFRDSGPRRQPVRAGRDRQHLHADHEPDPGGVRGPDRQPRGRDPTRRSASPARWPWPPARRPRPSPSSTWPRRAATSCRRPRSTAAPTTCFHYTLPKLGIETTFIDDPDDLDAWRAAVRPNTKAFYGETIGNPQNDFLDIEGVSERGPRERRAADRRQHRGHAVADPAVRVGRRHRRALGHQVHRRPRHSIGGVIVDGGTFDFSASDKFPQFTEPDPSYHGLQYWPALGPGSYIIKARVQLLRDIGAAISPFNSFLFLQGLETLSLRMERHNANAQRVAEYLAGHAQVESVQYAGLADSPWYDRAERYTGGRGSGSVPAFIIKGGIEAGQRVRRGA